MDAARIYLGTYSDKGSKGIYITELARSTGKLSPPVLAAEAKHATFLALRPDGRVLYAVNETYENSNGAVSAYAVDTATGKLTFLNQQPSHGGGPCYVETDRTGKCVLVANYGGGSIAAFTTETDGKLNPASASIKHGGEGQKAHAHCFTTSPDNRFALAVDLGVNKVMVYRLNASTGTLTPNDPDGIAAAPGAGPRHIRFHQNGRFAYVVNELNATVTAYTWDAQGGVLKEIETVPMLPRDFTGKPWAAELVIHPNGKFLYASNRSQESIARYIIDTDTGRLSPHGQVPTGGKTPRGFAVDPSGAFLVVAHQDTSDVMVFSVDASSGELTPTGSRIEVGAAVCVRFA